MVTLQAGSLGMLPHPRSQQIRIRAGPRTHLCPVNSIQTSVSISTPTWVHTSGVRRT